MNIDQFTGTYTNADFYLPSSHPAFMHAGSDSTFEDLQSDPNIIGGRPNVVVATENIAFEDAGISEDNTSIIYFIGDNIKSYVPGRLINSINSFEADKSYYLVALESLLIASLIPPIPE